jgi:predicted nucleic acid-binding Zn ribbon protein
MEFDYCRNPSCGAYIKPGRLKYCSEECREESVKERKSSTPARFVILQRILREEKINWADDRLAHSENFYQALQEWPCIWCGSEQKGTGIGLDRIDPKHSHHSWNVAPCCSNLCNKIRSDVLSFEEMAILRPGLVAIRIRRGNTHRNQQ